MLIHWEAYAFAARGEWAATHGPRAAGRPPAGAHAFGHQCRQFADGRQPEERHDKGAQFFILPEIHAGMKSYPLS